MPWSEEWNKSSKIRSPKEPGQQGAMEELEDWHSHMEYQAQHHPGGGENVGRDSVAYGHQQTCIEPDV
jgi:hypothetical protein